MKKALILLTAAFILFSLSLNFASAEFWQRDEERVRDITRPEHYTSEKHDRLPTTEPTPLPPTPQPTEPQPTQVEPTSPPVPTGTTAPPVGGVDGNGDGGDEEGNGDDQGEAGKQEEELVSQVSAPSVLGLSDTSSGGFALSDIMLLAGALCLTLYLRSKTEAKLLQ